MTSCLGLYIEKSFIKYAKLQKEKDTIRVANFNVEIYQKLNETISKIIHETNSTQIPIRIYIANELQGKLDIKANIDKKNIDIVPISTNIFNLLKLDKDENIAIIHIEDKTQIFMMLEGKIQKEIVLEEGMRQMLEEISSSQNSILNSYEAYKNLIIPTKNIDVLDEDDENVYMEKIQPILYKIVTKTKEMIEEPQRKITKLYITGSGTNIQNLDVYFQEQISNIKCAILKPFFLETTSIRTSMKDYIEVNSAIALALNGLGYDVLNENEKKESQITENKKLSVSEKLMLRLCMVFVILIISLFSFSHRAYRILEESNYAITQVSHQIAEQFSLMNNDLDKINSKAKEYARMTQNVKSLTEIEQEAENNRIISKNSIPDMLNEIMELIPREVKIISITNVEDSKQILIEAESEKYEQLGYFSSVLKTENILKNMKSTSGSKEGEVVKITIEGELP